MSKCISQHWPRQDAITTHPKTSYCNESVFVTHITNLAEVNKGEGCPTAYHSTFLFNFYLAYPVCVHSCVREGGHVCQRTSSGAILTFHLLLFQVSWSTCSQSLLLPPRFCGQLLLYVGVQGRFSRCSGDALPTEPSCHSPLGS